jgi:membrane-anchored mycosin MYCP
MITDPRDDLVVALPYLKLVMNALREAGVDHSNEPTEESELLGLARIRLRDPRRIAEALQTWKERDDASEISTCRQPESTDSDLDRILWTLRAGFAARYGNWIPTMGKNRVLGRVPGMQNPELGMRTADRGVSGAEEVSHGGGGAPQAVDGDGWPTARATRERDGVSVGILDSALRPHPFLEGAWIGPPPVVEANSPVAAEAGHATFVAGLVLRQAPGASLDAATLLDDHGVADSWTAAQEIVRLGQRGIAILNLSFVSYTLDSEAPLVLATAVDRLPPEVVVVAAAGNHGFLPHGENRKPAWPAALDDVLAVGALRADCQDLAPFSPDGPWVDVVAPGVGLVSTFLTGNVDVWRDPDGAGPEPTGRTVEKFAGFAKWSGTSFAAAMISGLIAARTRPGRASAREARDWILKKARQNGGEGGAPPILNPRTVGMPPWCSD